MMTLEQQSTNLVSQSKFNGNELNYTHTHTDTQTFIYLIQAIVSKNNISVNHDFSLFLFFFSHLVSGVDFQCNNNDSH